MTEKNINIPEENIDFSYYFNIVLKHFWLLIFITAVGIATAVLVNIFTRPVYKASVLMMIDKEDSGKIDANPIASWTGGEDYYRTQYQLLETRTLLQKVYNTLNLSQYEEFTNPNGWDKLRRHINVNPILRSRLVNLEAFSYDAGLASDIANALASAFVQENLTNRISMAQDVIKALESTERSPQEQELLNSMPQVVNSDFIKNLKQQEIQLQGALAKLSSKYTENHPDVISAKNQLNSIKNKIDIETRRLIQSIKIDLSGQFSGNNIRIVDSALTPRAPYKPRKLLNLLIGSAGGFILSLLLIFFLDFLDKTIKSSEDMEVKMHLPFLGFIPIEKDKKLKSEYEHLTKNGNFLMSEQVRNVRTMLDFALTSQRNAPVLITSSLQGEGKSHLAVNLAVAIAQTGKKVLLVDGDLRRGRLHKAFKLTSEKGLSNLWDSDEKKADFAYNVQQVSEIKNLFIMTSGKRPPNPAEILNTPLLEAFVKWAIKTYDIVLVDCPAILPVSDTLLWGRYIDKAIFMIKYGKTGTAAAHSAIEKLKKADIKILGGVIGHYHPQTMSYGKYGYYKSYSYYHYE